MTALIIGKKWLAMLGPDNRQFLAALAAGQDLQSKRLLDREFEKLKEYKKQLCCEIYTDGESKQHLPIPIDRLIKTAKMMFQSEDW